MTRRERLEARAERRREWAASRAKQGEQAHEHVHEIADRIPFGQPILVGHHSERGHRRDVARIENGMASAVENWRMADHHVEKAAGIERQLRTSIFSDDTDAVERLTAKVAALEARRDRVKAYNAAARKKGVGPAEAGMLAKELLDEGLRRELVSLIRLGSYHAPGGCFPSYMLTNLGAEIRRSRARLEEIQRGQATLAAGGRGRGRQMVARFSSSCADCGAPIEKGSEIVYFKLAREAVHVECEVAAASREP